MCVIFHVFYSKIHKSASKGFPVCTTYSTLYRQLHKCLQSFLAWRQECEIFDLAANKFTVIFHHAKDLSLRIYWIQKGCCSCQTFTRSYAGKCSDVECEPCESQLYFSKDVSGGRGGFFIAHFSSVVVHSFYHRHVLLLHNTPTSKRKHNLPRGVDLEARIWKTYGRVESHRAAALVCLVTSSARGGMHRWDLSFGVTGCCSWEFTCKERKK